MKKQPDESWLHYFKRLVSDLSRDKRDWKYWSNVFAMAGAACLAVAFIQYNTMALFAGLAFCLYGLVFNRRR